MMAIKQLFAACATLSIMTCAASAEPSIKALADARPLYGAWGFDLTAMDPAVKPGDDFNRYASGAWLARTPIPTDKPIASLRYLMTDLTEARLHALLGKASETAPANPKTVAEKTGAFYKAFMDEPRIEASGFKPILPELAAIRSATREDMTSLMGADNSDFYGTIFGVGTDVDLKDVGHYAVYLGQAGLGLPDRDYYLKPSFAAQKSRL